MTTTPETPYFVEPKRIVRPVRRDIPVGGKLDVETCNPEDAEFWGVYRKGADGLPVHVEDHGAEDIAQGRADVLNEAVERARQATNFFEGLRALGELTVEANPTAHFARPPPPPTYGPELLVELEDAQHGHAHVLDLLVQYVEHVRLAEGITFLGDFDETGVLTDEQRLEIRRLWRERFPDSKEIGE